MSSKLVELFIYSKKMNDGKWTKYSTKATFFIKGEDGKLSKERVEHFIDVKFTKEAFVGSKVKESDIKRGILSVDSSFVGCPDIYEIKTKEDGTKEYPTCYIRGGIDSFRPVTKEHVFHFITEEDTNEVEVEEENE